MFKEAASTFIKIPPTNQHLRWASVFGGAEADSVVEQYEVLDDRARFHDAAKKENATSESSTSSSANVKIFERRTLRRGYRLPLSTPLSDESDRDELDPMSREEPVVGTTAAGPVGGGTGGGGGGDFLLLSLKEHVVDLYYPDDKKKTKLPRTRKRFDTCKIDEVLDVPKDEDDDEEDDEEDHAEDDGVVNSPPNLDDNGSDAQLRGKIEKKRKKKKKYHYRLNAMVLHLGSSFRSGRYITIARRRREEDSRPIQKNRSAPVDDDHDNNDNVTTPLYQDRQDWVKDWVVLGAHGGAGGGGQANFKSSWDWKFIKKSATPLLLAYKKEEIPSGITWEQSEFQKRKARTERTFLFLKQWLQERFWQCKHVSPG